MGKYRHEKGVKKKRQIRGRNRVKLARQLRYKTPTQVANKLNAKANMNAVKAGNRTNLPEKQVIRQIGYEVRGGILQSLKSLSHRSYSIVNVIHE